MNTGAGPIFFRHSWRFSFVVEQTRSIATQNRTLHQITLGMHETHQTWCSSAYGFPIDRLQFCDLLDVRAKLSDGRKRGLRFGSRIVLDCDGVLGILGGCAGRIIERIGIGRSYHVGILLLAISLGIIILPSMTASLTSAVLFGSTYIFLTSVFIVWATRLFRPNTSIGISLAFLALGAGQFFGSSIAGYTIDAFSNTTAFIAFAILGLFGLLIRVKVED